MSHHRSQAHARPHPSRHAGAPGVAIGQAHLDRPPVGERAGEAGGVRVLGGQGVNGEAAIGEPRNELVQAGSNRRRGQSPPREPADGECSKERDTESEGREGVHRHASQQDAGTSQEAPARPTRAPDEITGHEERDEGSVEHQDRRIAAMQDGTSHRAVFAMPDGGRHNGQCRRKGGRRHGIARRSNVRAQEDDDGHPHQGQKSDGGDDFGRRRQPARNVVQPAGDVVGQLGAAGRKSLNKRQLNAQNCRGQQAQQQICGSPDTFDAQGRCAHIPVSVLSAHGVPPRSNRRRPLSHGRRPWRTV